MAKTNVGNQQQPGVETALKMSHQLDNPVLKMEAASRKQLISFLVENSEQVPQDSTAILIDQIDTSTNPTFAKMVDLTLNTVSASLQQTVALVQLKSFVAQERLKSEDVLINERQTLVQLRRECQALPKQF